MTSEEATLAKNPRFNGFACGHGVHGDVKYNRAKQKRMTQKFLGDQGASRGSFLFAQFLISPIFLIGLRKNSQDFIMVKQKHKSIRFNIINPFHTLFFCYY